MTKSNVTTISMALLSITLAFRCSGAAATPSMPPTTTPSVRANESPSGKHNVRVMMLVGAMPASKGACVLAKDGRLWDVMGHPLQEQTPDRIAALEEGPFALTIVVARATTFETVAITVVQFLAAAENTAGDFPFTLYLRPDAADTVGWPAALGGGN
jgi:hypothetical protein